MNWLYIIAIIIVVTVAVLYFLPSLTGYPSSFKEGPFLLAESPSIFAATETNALIDGGNTTFQGYFYILPLDRTPTAMKCGEPGYPSCEDGRFQTCVCETSSCKNCTFHGYENLISIGNIIDFQILGTPDAGRPGKAMAQLSIRTQSPVDASGGEVLETPVFYTEVIDLPPIPIQKWVMITIARTGRRIDVFYNNELVSSSKTLYMLATNAERTKTTTVGSPRISGYSGLMNKYDSNLSSYSVSSYYKSSSDTLGAPVMSQNLPTISGNQPRGSNAGPTLPGFAVTNFPIPSLCSGGSCLEPPSGRPANPLYDWETPYA